MLSYVSKIGPLRYAYGLYFGMICFGWLMIDFSNIIKGYITNTGVIILLFQCKWSDPEEYGWINLIILPWNKI